MMISTSTLATTPLSCGIKNGTLGSSPKIQEFTWSTAHESDEPTGPIKTSIGVINPTEGPRYTTNITVNKKVVALSPNLEGLIRFGKVYDYQGQVALAYLVERGDDASAAPSEVVVLLDQRGSVINSDFLPGTNAELSDYCGLIE